MANDDDLAEAMEGMEVEPAPAVRLEEFTPEVQYLAELVDRINVLVDVVAQVAGGRIDLPPAARPESATDRLARRREDENYADLEADVAKAQKRHKKAHPKEV